MIMMYRLGGGRNGEAWLCPPEQGPAKVRGEDWLQGQN
jgi:hypothetical protein